jgi:zinc transport system substrate-binding protein
LVGHDAFQYFENMIGVAPSGFVTDALGAAPTIQIMQDLSVSAAKCIIADENETNPHSARIAETIGAKIVVANPNGSTLALGADLYMAMIRELADDYAACLGVK